MTSTFPINEAANLNTVMHGNCVNLMNRMPSGSVDFVITDPPYITRYCARDGTHRRQRRQCALAQACLRADAPASDICRVLRQLLRLE